jgi:hypothetical protein
MDDFPLVAVRMNAEDGTYFVIAGTMTRGAALRHIIREIADIGKIDMVSEGSEPQSHAVCGAPCKDAPRAG